MSHGTAAAGDLLGAIVAATRRIVDVRAEREPLDRLAARAERVATRGGGRLYAALRKAAPGAGPAGSLQSTPRVIAECKRRSPSRGVLRSVYDPVAIARGYEAAGAAAISVLTEPTFFDGSLDHLAAVRAAVRLPLLRKDFIVSQYQLFEARAAGADAVLLIVAALDRTGLVRLHRQAEALGLDALVEVHSLGELESAAEAGARIIGVNNRNLRTLDVDVAVSEQVIARMPRDVVAVSESGLKTAADLIRLEQLGYQAFLIGERFMTHTDPGAGLKAVLADYRAARDGTDMRCS